MKHEIMAAQRTDRVLRHWLEVREALIMSADDLPAIVSLNFTCFVCVCVCIHVFVRDRERFGFLHIRKNVD
jgi:hypothetical protein